MLPGIARAPLRQAAAGSNDADVVLLMHFDGANGATSGAGFADSSLRANKGNATNAGASSISTAQSKFGGSSFINSANGYCTFPSHAEYNFGSSDFTIDWWEYRTSTGAVIARDLPTTYTPFLIYNAGSGNTFYATSTGSSWDIANAKAWGVNPANQWHHYAITRSGSNFFLFYDGAVVNSWSSSAALITNSNPLCIGAAQNGLNNSAYTEELRISRVARWTAAFTPPTAPYGPDYVPPPGNDAFVKLLLHFDGADNSTSFIDASPSARGAATVGGTAKVSTAASKFGGASGLFASSWISYPDHADWTLGTGPFTVDFWFNRQGGDGTQRFICGTVDTSGIYNGTGFVIQLNAANKIQADIGNGSAGVSLVGTTAFTTAGWHHVAHVRDVNTMRLFVDGVQEATTSFAGTVNDPSSTLTIGRYGDYGAPFWNGYIDEFRFSKGIARWTTNFTPPTVPYS